MTAAETAFHGVSFARAEKVMGLLGAAVYIAFRRAGFIGTGRK